MGDRQQRQGGEAAAPQRRGSSLCRDELARLRLTPTRHARRTVLAPALPGAPHRTPWPGLARVRAHGYRRESFHARLHRPPSLPVHPGDAGGRVHLVLAVQLRRAIRSTTWSESRRPSKERERMAEALGPERIHSPSSSPASSGTRCTGISASRTGFRCRSRKPSRNGFPRRWNSSSSRRGARAGDRRPARGVHRAAPRRGDLPPPAHHLAGRHLPADLPDRHPPDPDLLGVARLAPVVRARGHRGHRMGEQSRVLGRIQVDHLALGHAVPLPAHPPDAARAGGDAGGAAHRLHQVREGAGADQPCGELRPRAEEHPGAGDYHHRPPESDRSSRSPSSPRRSFSGPAWGCCSSRPSSSWTFR